MGVVLYPAVITPVDGPLVFLAGPIQGAPDWQQLAIEWFRKHSPNISVASPRRVDRTKPFHYESQVDWETHYLRYAAQHGVIMFWLPCEVVPIPGRAYAQTSRFEIAEWKVRHERDGIKLIVGIEAGFSGERYIRHRFGQDCPNVPITSSLMETCATVHQLTQLI